MKISYAATDRDFDLTCFSCSAVVHMQQSCTDVSLDSNNTSYLLDVHASERFFLLRVSSTDSISRTIDSDSSTTITFDRNLWGNKHCRKKPCFHEKNLLENGRGTIRSEIGPLRKTDTLHFKMKKKCLKLFSSSNTLIS